MNYIKQDDDVTSLNMWEGNHKYVNGLRNQMTHRNSPNVSAMSNFDFNLKDSPTYQLKRIIEDYVVVSTFLNKILDDIENNIIENYCDKL